MTFARRTRAETKASRRPYPLPAGGGIGSAASYGAVALLAMTTFVALYPATALPGWLRPCAVIGAGLCLAAAGTVCLRRPPLHAAGQALIAVAALLVPVACVAGYVFLSLDGAGLSPGPFMLASSSACAVLYGVLALRLGTYPYGALSLLAVGSAWLAAAAVLHLGPWSGPAMLPLGWCLLGLASERAPALLRRVYASWWEPATHLWALLTALVTLAIPPASPVHGWAVAICFLSLGTRYAGYMWLSRRGWMAWAPVTALSLAVLGVNGALRLGQTGVVFELVSLATLCLAAAQVTQPARQVLRWCAAVLLALSALLAVELAWAHGVALLVATGLAVLLAVQSRQPAWIVLAAGIFSAAYYWLAQPILPLPAASFANPAVMVPLYAPLPVAMTAAAVIVRGITSRRWAVPLYACAGLLALPLCLAAFRTHSFALLAQILIVYGGVLYLVARLERSIIAGGPALLAAGLAVAAILAAYGAAPAAYVLSGSVFGLVVYGAHRVWWPAPRLDELHRLGGLGVSGLTAAACLPLSAFWHSWSWAPLIALGSMVVFALLLWAESRQYERSFLVYPMTLVLSLGAIWIASFLGASDPRLYLAVPAAAIIALAVKAPQDPWLPKHPVGLCRAAAAFGSFLLLGPSAYEALLSPTPWPQLGLLALEAGAALLAGIHTRNRVLAVSGGVGVALGALWAAVLLTLTLSPMIVLGVLAVLLSATAALFLSHEGLGRARSRLARRWQTWT